MFFLIGLGLTLLTAAVLVWPLLRRAPNHAGVTEEQLAASFRDRQILLRKDLEAGLITAEQALRAEEALAIELAERLRAEGYAPQQPADSPRRPWLAASLLALLPVLGISTYLVGGSPELTIPGALQSHGRENRHAMLEPIAADPDRYREAVKSMRAALAQNPGEVDTWLMLAMLHKTAGDYLPAVESFAEAARRGADRDARFLAEYAEAIALSRDKRFAGEPYALLQQAMRLDGRDAKVVSLMAAAHYQAGERAQARALLEQLLAGMAPDNPQQRQLREVIAGLADPPPDASASQAAARIEVSLAVAPEMLHDLEPGAILFVSVRAAQGPRMPIAVWRGPAPRSAEAQLIILDASRQIDPARKLEGALVVEAHIARNGQAGRQPGDPVADPVSVVLDTSGSGASPGSGAASASAAASASTTVSASATPSASATASASTTVSASAATSAQLTPSIVRLSLQIRARYTP